MSEKSSYLVIYGKNKFSAAKHYGKCFLGLFSPVLASRSRQLRAAETSARLNYGSRGGNASLARTERFRSLLRHRRRPRWSSSPIAVLPSIRRSWKRFRSNHLEKKLSEGRKSDRIKIVLLAASACLLLLVVGVVVSASYVKDEDGRNDGDPQALHSSGKSVTALCSSTDYVQACEASLAKAVPEDTQDPKVVLKAVVSVALDEVSKGFAHSRLLASNDSRVRGAVQDCQEMYEDSKGEINATLRSIIDHDIENLPARSHDMRTWLSAVVTYQQTCIDGFPDGELKDRMNAAMKGAKELTSNALAIISKASSLLSLIDLSSRRRRLLDDQKFYPFWFTKDHRRMLRNLRGKLTPNVTVAKDGTGNFTTINEALADMPEKYEGRYVIYVKEGEYEEQVNVTKKMVDVTMYGDGAKTTIITGSKNFVDGTRTFLTATFYAGGNRFMAVGLTFRNTAGAAKHQAVALRVVSDQSVFLNCRMEGYQDTLYAHAHRQFYRGCVIAGTIDFIFGDASAVFQNCLLVVRRPLANQQNIVTAQGRADRRQVTGFVIQRCRILADRRLADASQPAIRSYLGRPWKEFSKTIIMESQIDGFIHKEGYLPWNGSFALSTLYYAEFRNTGPGADVAGRVKWPGLHVINRSRALKFTVENFIEGSTWIPASGAPLRLGLNS
ncbi:putative pectinesterase/pectinesterase inhibitor 13 [Curcuma longa]|uniref:putative pectinesterase/pectinesterase inhibitor 13 n=1 Tax=Curcuma longa TaxID=136217 RepID=UPI003D9F1862